jgi:hypothetical protein
MVGIVFAIIFRRIAAENPIPGIVGRGFYKELLQSQNSRWSAGQHAEV